MTVFHPLRKISVNDHFFTTERIIPLKACEKQYDQTRLPFINVEYNFDTSSLSLMGSRIKPTSEFIFDMKLIVS